MQAAPRLKDASDGDLRNFGRSVVLLHRWVGVWNALQHVKTTAGREAVRQAYEDVANETDNFLSHKDR